METSIHRVNAVVLGAPKDGHMRIRVISDDGEFNLSLFLADNMEVVQSNNDDILIRTYRLSADQRAA